MQPAQTPDRGNAKIAAALCNGNRLLLSVVGSYELNGTVPVCIGPIVIFFH
jgi:hypothetical protein